MTPWTTRERAAAVGTVLALVATTGLGVAYAKAGAPWRWPFILAVALFYVPAVTVLTYLLGDDLCRRGSPARRWRTAVVVLTTANASLLLGAVAGRHAAWWLHLLDRTTPGMLAAVTLASAWVVGHYLAAGPAVDR